MTWLGLAGKNYTMLMLDGYVLPPPGIAASLLSPAHIELARAEGLYRMLQGAFEPEGSGNGKGTVSPPALHTWFVGHQGWTKRTPRLVRPLTSGDRDPAYRILIVGLGRAVEPGQPMNASLATQCMLGVVRSKHRQDLDSYLDLAGSFLEGLLGVLESTGTAPTEELAALGAPVHYCGGTGKEIELRYFSERTPPVI